MMATVDLSITIDLDVPSAVDGECVGVMDGSTMCTVKVEENGGNFC